MSQLMPPSFSKNSNDTDQPDVPSRCHVVSVEKSKAPGEAPGTDWYRYVIDSPGSPITGYRRGKKSEVIEYLDECTRILDERLNMRKPKSPRSGVRKSAKGKAAN